MSQLSSTASPQGAQKTHQKQRINVYTIMLLVSFIAISLACVALYFELEKYGKYPWWDTNEANPASSTPAAPDASSALPASELYGRAGRADLDFVVVATESARLRGMGRRDYI